MSRLTAKLESFRKHVQRLERQRKAYEFEALKIEIEIEYRKRLSALYKMYPEFKPSPEGGKS